MSSLQKFNDFQMLICSASNIAVNNLTNTEKSIIFTHFCNIQAGLICVDNQGEKIQFPLNWNQHFQGVYKFTYKANKEKGKIYQFRFVITEEGNGRLMVNFVEEDGDELHSIEVQFVESQFEVNLKQYVKKIRQIIFPQEKLNQNNNPLEVRRLEPVWRQPREEPQIRQPYPMQPLRSNDPFQIPFSGNQYVGPNSEIFGNRIGPPSQNPNNRNLRRPPGSRFDPIDPFGNEDFNDPGNNDFSGFNSFGQPFGGRGNFGGNGFGGGNNNFFH